MRITVANGWDSSDHTGAVSVAGSESGSAESARPTQVAWGRISLPAVVCAVLGMLGATALEASTHAGLGQDGPGVVSGAAEQVRPGQVFRDCDVCPKMVVVPPGSYTRGSLETEEGRSDDEGPQRRVTIEYSLAVGMYEVTFDEWDACVSAGECWGYQPSDQGWGRGSRPVVDVSWDEAKDYAGWLSRETGEEYRLLTEAEWEYVARAGTETARYWDESGSPPCRYANVYDREAAEYDDRWGTARDGGDQSDCSDGYVHTAPVGMYAPNAFGLYDMFGNVSEWTEDCWDDDYSAAPVDGRRGGRYCSDTRVYRGGFFRFDPESLRSARRDYTVLYNRYGSTGFRVARVVDGAAQSSTQDPPPNSTAAPFRDCGECPEMVVVPPGSYMMGSPAAEDGRYDDEGPQHRVTIGYSLAVGVYEVTNEEWFACQRGGGCSGGYEPNVSENSRNWHWRQPANSVSWSGAQAYVQWLSEETGQEYRLLSEAEWEYAARAGTTTAGYWGEDELEQCRYGNGFDRTGYATDGRTGRSGTPARVPVQCSDGFVGTAPVGRYEPNAFGLYDMLGNLSEWTQDCWHNSYSGAPEDGSAWMEGDCAYQVVRGGSYYGFGGRNRLRSAVRSSMWDDSYRDYIGFRVARTVR